MSRAHLLLQYSSQRFSLLGVGRGYSAGNVNEAVLLNPSGVGGVKKPMGCSGA